MLIKISFGVFKKKCHFWNICSTVLLPFSSNVVEFYTGFTSLSDFYPSVTETMLKSQGELADKLLAMATLAEV